MAAEISSPNRLDRILLTLGVITAKLDGVTALKEDHGRLETRLRAAEESLATLKAEGSKSSSTWTFVWLAVNSLGALAAAVAGFIPHH